MLSLTQTTGYAVRALGCLADGGTEFLMARQVSDCTGIPLPYLSKVLNTLAREGMIEAKRGYQGGFRLSRPASAISLLEVADAVEGPEWRSACLLGLDGCHAEDPCPAHPFWERHRAEIEGELGRLTVASMAEYERRPTVAKLKHCTTPGSCGNSPVEGVSDKGKPASQKKRPTKPTRKV